MSIRSEHPARHRRTPSLESLETRNLLSAGVHGHHAHVARSAGAAGLVAIYGTETETTTSRITSSSGITTISADGSGSANLLGRFTESLTVQRSSRRIRIERICLLRRDDHLHHGQGPAALHRRCQRSGQSLHRPDDRRPAFDQHGIHLHHRRDGEVRGHHRLDRQGHQRGPGDEQCPGHELWLYFTTQVILGQSARSGS